MLLIINCFHQNVHPFFFFFFTDLIKREIYPILLKDYY